MDVVDVAVVVGVSRLSGGVMGPYFMPIAVGVAVGLVLALSAEWLSRRGLLGGPYRDGPSAFGKIGDIIFGTAAAVAGALLSKFLFGSESLLAVLCAALVLGYASLKLGRT